MSTVDDVRKLFQDLIAPELRSISVRLDGFEKRVDERFVALEKRFDERFAAVDRRFAAADQRMDGIEKRLVGLDAQIAQRFGTLDQRMWTNQTQTIDAIHRLSDYDRLAQRVSAIEEKSPEPAGSEH